MKLFIRSLVTGASAALLFVVSTGIVYADKGGNGNRGGSGGGGSSRVASRPAGGGMQSGHSGGQQFNKGSASSSTANRMGNPQSGNKSSIAQSQSQVNKVNVNKGNIQVGKSNQVGKVNQGQHQSFTKMPSVQHHNKMPSHHNYKNNFYCGTPWKNNCSPYNSSYCGWGSGCWNTSYFPWYRNYCYTPCYNYCAYPTFAYACSTPVVWSYQAPVTIASQVVEVVQPAPVVETVASTTTSASSAVVQPAPQDMSFLTGSALGGR